MKEAKFVNLLRWIGLDFEYLTEFWVWWCVNSHRQLHSQFESSTPAKKKTIIEDLAGVGHGGEAPMLKLAKNLDISQIKRDFL